jgi:hypothetical protein
MSIYDDLLRFNRGLLARVEHDIATLSPIARRAAAVDVKLIQDQFEVCQARLDIWYGRAWELHALWLDPEG